MPSKIVELAIFWLPIIGGGVFWSLAGNAYYSGHKSHALWLGFGGAICFILLGAIQLQKAIWDSEQQTTDLSPTERPWVAIDRVLPATNLAYDNKGWDAGTRWHITIRYELRDTGRTPAIAADIHADMLPFLIPVIPADRIKNGIPQGPPDPGTDVDAELKRLCTSAAEMRNHLPPLSAITLYPDSAPTVGFFTLNGNPKLFEKAKTLPGYSGNFVILICVTYKFPSGAKVHQTGGGYALFKPDAKIDIQGETVPLNDLRIVPQPLTSGLTT